MTKSFSTTFMITAISYFILGLALVFWPQVSRLVICYTVGILLMIYGLGRILAQWNSFGFLSLGNGYLGGLLALLLGILLVVRADAVLATFSTLLGLILVADNFIKLQVSYQLRIKHMGCCRRNTISALVLLLLGLIVLFNPFAAVNAMTIFIGITLILNAVINFIIALDIRRYLQDTIIITK